MLGYLKDVFLTILIYLLSIMVISNILEYIQVLPKLFFAIANIQTLFDYLNLTYIISLIYKTKFKDLDLLISNRSAVSKI